MEENKPSELPKEAQIMLNRVSEELRHELTALPLEKRIRVLEALQKLHRMMEAEVYELALRIIRACLELVPRCANGERN